VPVWDADQEPDLAPEHEPAAIARTRGRGKDQPRRWSGGTGTMTRAAWARLWDTMADHELDPEEKARFRERAERCRR